MWASLIMNLVGPVVVRALISLGFGVVSFTGFTALLTLIRNQIQTNLNGLPADAVSILFLAGVPQAIGIILSALVARVALAQTKKIQLR